jgi:hypothetical protein
MQDALCTISTGGGFASRTLFTNGEETVIEVKRPVVINSIPNVVTAQDLTDRAIHVELPEIFTYREESEIEKAFEEALPEIFGSLLDLFVQALSFLPQIKQTKPPRMADFTALGEAMMQSAGASAGAFTELYRENRKESVLRAIESSPVATALLEMMRERRYEGGFDGTYKELSEVLLPYKQDNEGWPKAARGLASALKRQSPALRSAGLIVVPEQGAHKQSNKGRSVSIRKSEQVNMVNIVSLESTGKEKTTTNDAEWNDDGRPF